MKTRIYSKKISIIIAVTAFVAFFTFSCNNDKSEKLSTELVNNPNSASASSKGDLPVFKFEKDEHDFGKIIEGEKVTYSFKFKNVGKSDLVIASASASCGCTVPDFPKNPVKPNEEATITVSFNSAGRSGFQHKTVTLVANTQPSNYTLSIKAMITSPEK
jgi:hypothetical protein